jgi:alpha/beta superfamily hydrolase
MQTFPNTETNFLISGPSGNLELLTAHPKETATPINAIAIICHPHPLYSGTMNNKVVTTLKRVFSDLGLRTVRFNFRGVGKSEGTYGDAVGELNDLLTVIDWVQSVSPNTELWLAGFSFGSYIAACAATTVPTKKLISIAPPVVNFDFENLAPISADWLVVQGDQDEIVDAKAVYAWVETINPKPTLIKMNDATHFFHGKLLELRDALEKNLS